SLVTLSFSDIFNCIDDADDDDVNDSTGDAGVVEQKYELITNHFKPNKGFVWPYKERKVVKNGKSIVQKRYLK
ncbi:unnamed protein product, partial [Rotaria sordida]